MKIITALVLLGFADARIKWLEYFKPNDLKTAQIELISKDRTEQLKAMNLSWQPKEFEENVFKDHSAD